MFFRVILVISLLSLGTVGFVDFRNRLNQQVLSSAPEPLAAVAVTLSERLATSNDPAALLRLGHHLLRASEPELAALVFNRTVELAPTSPEAHLYLGWSLLLILEQGKLTSSEADATLARARASLTTAQTLDPANELVRKLIQALPD